jgi:hypothetical protein
VAARHESRERKPDDAVLAHDDAMDVFLDALEKLGRTPGLEGLFLGRGGHQI